MSLNKAMIIGNLGNDPEMKYTQGGLSICRFRVATTERKKDRDGNAVETTEWHTVKAFGKLADICGEFLAKGAKVFVEGRIHYDTFEGADGVKKHFTEILADKMDMLDRSSDSARAPRQDPTEGRHAPAHPSAPAPRVDDFADDDIPF